MNFSLSYELRNPAWTGRPFPKFYSQVLEQIAWAEKNGFTGVSFPEHHGEGDGYCPSPLTFAAAVAARTSTIPISIGLLVVTLHNPVEVAERFAMVDILSNGRLSLTVGGGYRTTDFDMYGVPFKTRAGRMVEALQIIKKCWEEENFDFQGKYWQLKNVRCMPKPVQKPRPKIFMGGNSEGAARRAARYADGFRPSNAGWMQYYQDELRKMGKDPGPAVVEKPRTNFGIYVSRDPDREWERIKKYCFHDWTEYSKFYETQDARAVNPFYRVIQDPEELRRSGLWQVMTPGEVVEMLKQREKEGARNLGLSARPAVGGIPLEMSQESLELIAKDVMPHFASKAPAGQTR